MNWIVSRIVTTNTPIAVTVAVSAVFKSHRKMSYLNLKSILKKFGVFGAIKRFCILLCF
jgi:hypothetical protein